MADKTLSPEARRAARAALEATVRAAILAVPGVEGFQSAGWRGMLGLRNPLRIHETAGGALRVHTRVRIAAGHAAVDVAARVRQALEETRYRMERVDVEVTRLG